MQDRSKTVVLIACAAQAVIVSATIAWVALTGPGASDSSAEADAVVGAECEEHQSEEQADESGSSYSYGDSSGDYGDDEAQECDAEQTGSSGGSGTSGGLDFTFY